MLSDESSIGEGVARLNRWHLGPGTSRVQQQSHAPLHAFYVVGRSLRVLSVFAAYRFLVESDVSVLLFAFFSLLGAAILFFLLQRPWKGKRLTNTQWGISVMNGGVLALAVVTWAYGLKQCGPLRSVMAEYSGAVVATISTMIFGRRGHRVLKLYGAIAMLAAFYLLASGIPLGPTLPPDFPPPANPVPLGLDSTAAATAALTAADSSTGSSSKGGAAGAAGGGAAGGEGGAGLLAWQVARMSGSGMVEAAGGNPLTAMLLPVAAGVLFALRRLLARLGKSQQKKRLHAVTAVSSVFFLLPIAIFQLSGGAQAMDLEAGGRPMQVYALVILAGLVFSFYVDTLAEDKLRIGPSSLKHLLVTSVAVVALLLMYRMHFSPLSFVLIALLLAAGLHWSTAIERSKSAGSLAEDGVAAKERRRTAALAMLQFLLAFEYGPPSVNLLRPSSLPPNPLPFHVPCLLSPPPPVFLLINAAFMIVEFSVGFLSNSLGLISDACHMLFDCAALAIGLYASYISRLDSPSKFAYGYGRFEVLSGFVNAVFLVLIAALIVFESIERILDPPDISTANLLAVSVGGLVVNMHGNGHRHEGEGAVGGDDWEQENWEDAGSNSTMTTRSLLQSPISVSSPLFESPALPSSGAEKLLAVHKARRRIGQGGAAAGGDENFQALPVRLDFEEWAGESKSDGEGKSRIFLHVLADTLGSVGVVISTLLIKYKGWMLTDPIESMAGVVAVRQRHFWSFTPKMLVGSIHVLISPDSLKDRAKDGGAAAHNRDAYSEYGGKQQRVEAVQQLRQSLRRRVSDVFRAVGITHITVE
ncbi:unnamed protein product, partial [Closterium sp. Naga37s-1]